MPSSPTVAAPPEHEQQKLARPALAEVSRRAHARVQTAFGISPVARKAVLHGQSFDVTVPSGTHGMLIGAEDLGSTIVSALQGYPGQLEMAMRTITTKLFARAEPPTFGGGVGSPAAAERVASPPVFAASLAGQHGFGT